MATDATPKHDAGAEIRNLISVGELQHARQSENFVCRWAFVIQTGLRSCLKQKTTRKARGKPAWLILVLDLPRQRAAHGSLPESGQTWRFGGQSK